MGARRVTVTSSLQPAARLTPGLEARMGRGVLDGTWVVVSLAQGFGSFKRDLPAPSSLLF